MGKTKYIFLMILIIALSIQIIYVLSEQLTFTLTQKVIIVSIQSISVIGFTHFSNLGKNAKIIKKNLNYASLFMYGLYVINLVYVLFLDPDFGRQALPHLMSVKDYIATNVNLKFFASIELFVKGYQNGYVTLETLLRNLLGNFIVFMPMAYFLPLFFKKQRKWRWFFVTIFLMVFSVELLQVILRIGSGDVDDLLLNVTGALTMYGFLKLLPLWRIYRLMERE